MVFVLFCGETKIPFSELIFQLAIFFYRTTMEIYTKVVISKNQQVLK